MLGDHKWSGHMNTRVHHSLVTEAAQQSVSLMNVEVVGIARSPTYKFRLNARSSCQGSGARSIQPSTAE